MKKRRLAIILPAYNEAKVIKGVLTKLQSYLNRLKTVEYEIIVVDDGSKDKTAKLAKDSGVTVVSHILNRGLGGALATGLSYAKKHGFDIALTMDSDGQHSPSDIAKAIEPIICNKADVVIGTRMMGQRGMPWDRIILNFLSNTLTFLLFRIWSSDSQSGFRVFNKMALQAIDLKTQGMEVSSEFFAEIKENHLRYAEVPITVIYSKYSRKKGQSNLNSIPITAKLFLRLFR
ncbi:MAG: glycosyltransferase family 2 protein [Patescibacteria group bacterium]|jgi:glycosyltransferase involved in cell wall biosynthesis